MPLVSTGEITIADVSDGLSISLSQSSHVVATAADGTGGDYSGASTTVSVLLGATDFSSSWFVTAVAGPGVVGALTESTYQVSDLTVDSGYVDFTATKQGFVSLTARFSITKAKQGAVGPTFRILPSAIGFTFTDGVADPADQVISIQAYRENSDMPVLFFASNGIELETDEGVATPMGFSLGMPIVGDGSVCYITPEDLGAGDQMYVTAIFGEATQVAHIARINYSTADAGATRNIFRGDFAIGQIYAVGDEVLFNGSGYVCRVQHIASVLNQPPNEPVTQNTWWTKSAAQGEQGERGTKQAAVAIPGTVWSDSAANAAIAAAGWGLPINGDVVTLYNSSVAFSQTRVYGNGVWIVLAAFFGGDVLVDGTILGQKIAAGTITGDLIEARAITADLIEVGSITGDLMSAGEIITLSAQIKDATISEAKISGTLSAGKITAGSALSGSITVSGTALTTVANQASLGALNPVTRINAQSTQIDPGKILISGGTSLSDWQGSTDVTSINGGKIETDSITARSLQVGLMPNLFQGGDPFDTSEPATAVWTVMSGAVAYVDSPSVNFNGKPVLYMQRVSSLIDCGMYSTYNRAFQVSPGEVLSVEIPTLGDAYAASGYTAQIYWYDAAGNPLAQYFTNLWSEQPIYNSYVDYSTQVTVPAGAANAIVLLYLTSSQSSVYVLYFGKIKIARTAGTVNIKDGAITADKMTVTSLSAISAVIGVLRTATSGARLEVHSDKILVYDASGVVRVKIGNLA